MAVKQPYGYTSEMLLECTTDLLFGCCILSVQESSLTNPILLLNLCWFLWKLRAFKPSKPARLPQLRNEVNAEVSENAVPQIGT